MTEQYKRMEKKLQQDLQAEQEKVWEQERTIKEFKDLIQRQKEDKDELTKKYDGQIIELNRRIQEMSSDFADMLKDTLLKMQDRVELANKYWPEDSKADAMNNYDHLTNNN